jgi:voltage-gated potassium channel Kch
MVVLMPDTSPIPLNSAWLKRRNRLATFWRRCVLRAWRAGRWLIIGGLWLITLALGYVGFAKLSAATGQARSPWDLFYLALQLFILESGSAVGPKTWELELARLLAPTVAAYTAVQALADLFVEQFQGWRLRRIRGHVVICGLGRKGFLLAKAFHERGEQVVVIEQDEDDNLLQPCRDLGALVLIGDATDRETLCRAGVQRAKYIVAAGGDDGANAEIAVHARTLAAGRHGQPLTCLVHVVDPQLCDLLREREIGAGDDSAFRLEFFNVFDLGVRAMLEEYPPFGSRKQVDKETGRQVRAVLDGNLSVAETSSSPPHLLVVGLGRMGRSLVVRAARSWRERQRVILSGSSSQSPLHGQSSEACPAPSPGPSARTGWPDEAREPCRRESRLRITVIDWEADRKVETLHLRYPELHKVCELIPRQMDVRWPEFERADFLYDAGGRCAVTAVYICLDDDSLGLTTALALLQKLRGQRAQRVPIVVRMADDAGLATLLREAGRDSDSFADLHAFGLLERTCRPDLLLGGTHETLARAIHEDYVRGQAAAGQTALTNPAMLPWDELPENLKESNRWQADHIGVKLRAVGCGLAPLTDWDAESFEFTPEEVEQMARLEHERWIAERLRAGWTYAPDPKDLARKTSPDLVPWDELSEAEREKDRSSVRGLPRFLARAGLQVYRMK